MRYYTQYMMKVAAGGAVSGAIALAIVAVFSFSHGDATTGECSVATQSERADAVAGVLLSPRTRLIIDYQRTALA